MPPKRKKQKRKTSKDSEIKKKGVAPPEANWGKTIRDNAPPEGGGDRGVDRGTSSQRKRKPKEQIDAFSGPIESTPPVIIGWRQPNKKRKKKKK